MLGDDAVVQPFVQLWATVDGKGAATGDGDGLHEFYVGWGHLTDFSKGIAGGALRGNELKEPAVGVQRLISRLDSLPRKLLRDTGGRF
jgi:hypothetical protein